MVVYSKSELQTTIPETLPSSRQPQSSSGGGLIISVNSQNKKFNNSLYIIIVQHMKETNSEPYVGKREED